MKKGCLALACAAVFACGGAWVGCDGGLFAERGETSFVVTCDYGKQVQGKVTYLLGGSSVFFNFDEYDIEGLVLGDIVTVEFTGEMVLQGKNPSKVNISGRILDIDVEDAEVLTVKYNGVSVVAEGKTNYTLENVPQYVIRDGAGNFMSLEECPAGTILYATYAEGGKKGKTVYLEGLYAYNPDR